MRVLVWGDPPAVVSCEVRRGHCNGDTGYTAIAVSTFSAIHSATSSPLVEAGYQTRRAIPHVGLAAHQVKHRWSGCAYDNGRPRLLEWGWAGVCAIEFDEFPVVVHGSDFPR